MKALVRSSDVSYVIAALVHSEAVRIVSGLLRHARIEAYVLMCCFLFVPMLNSQTEPTHVVMLLNAPSADVRSSDASLVRFARKSSGNPLPINVIQTSDLSKKSLVTPLAIPSDTHGFITNFGEIVAIARAWSYYPTTCTAAGPVSGVLSPGPSYGSVSATLQNMPVPAGNPCAGDSLPAVTAYYTWTTHTIVTTLDYFHLEFQAAGSPFADYDFQPELLAKELGDCCTQSGGVGAGDPINVGSGNVFERVTDYETAGQNKLSFIRYYNSMGVPNTFAGVLGNYWRSNYERYLFFYSSSLIVAERPDGRLVNFTSNGSQYVADNDVDMVLTNSGSTWTLTDHDDTVETYSVLNSVVGIPTSITQRNGYVQTMAYNSGYQLTSITDSYGRQLTLSYLPSGVLGSVTTPDGLVLNYGFDSVEGTDDRLASVSYSTSPVTSRQYVYGNSSLPYGLTAIIDENGNTYQTWTYDQFSRGLMNQVGGSANQVTVAYNDANGSRVLTNALGVTDTYTFAISQDAPRVIGISRAATSTTAAATESFAYDANGYQSSEIDWDGNQTTYVNNSHGDPTTINEAVGSAAARTTTIAYDPSWVHLPDSITTPGVTTAFTYDSGGNVLTKTLTDTTTQSAPYSTNGATRIWQYTWQNALLASVQSPRTDVAETTSYTYDSTGALTRIANPLNQQTNITSHTGGGLPLTIVDPNSVTTNLAYDPRQRLLTSTVVTSAGNRTTTYGYDAAENLTSVTQPDGSGLTYTYDAAHRLTAITDLFGQKISYTLDALGDATATSILNVSNTATSTHSNSFDALGRMLQDIGAASQASSFAYDAMGNMVTATDQANHTTQRAFDALNRLTQITDPASGVTTTSYDAHDRPVSVTAPNGGATAYVYDGFGDLIQESNPNTGTTVYHYDSAGNRSQRIAATGAVTNYTYDALDRVLSTSFPSDSAENVAYTYDESGHGSGVGRLTSVADAAGTLARSYDQLGNLLTETRTRGAVVLNAAYSYDAANRISAITYPSGAVVSYTRDTMGRITAVSAQPSGGASAPVVSSVAYEPFGPYSGLTYGNSVAESRGFDQDYRLTGVTDTGSSVLQNLSYAYYPTNNVQTITDAVTSGNSQSFSYDSLQRLSQASGGYGTFGFTYDSNGNRLSQADGMTTTNYGYGSGTDLLGALSEGGIVTQTLSYTADGRIASLSPGIQAPGGQYITSLSYNQDARLSAVNAAGGTLASYTYDGFGQRLVKTISGATGKLYQYGRDGMLLEETNASGVMEGDYIYIEGQPIAVLNNTTSTMYTLHDDLLGTPQLASSSNQGVAWRANYLPFGAASVNGTVIQNLRFPGQYFDAESGWNHNGFRDYIPALGRYAEPDPMTIQGSAMDLNLNTGKLIARAPFTLEDSIASPYDYAKDDPTNTIDPSGQTKIHGNWCGPDWTGGKVEQYDPNRDVMTLGFVPITTPSWPIDAKIGEALTSVPYYNPPVDSVDSVCETHDKCYYKAREQYPCDKEQRRRAMERCDANLLKDIPTNTFWGVVVYGGIRAHPSDPGANPASCHCDK